MIREDDKIYFTEQDKQNIILKNYTKEELKVNEMSFKKKQNTRRVIFFIVLLIIISLLIFIKSIKYLLYIAIVFLIFLIILSEYIDIINIKAVRRKHYFEIIINEKMKKETYLEQTLSPGSKVSTFYPVKGTINGTNYKSIFYINEEQYNKNIGEKIRITVK